MNKQGTTAKAPDNAAAGKAVSANEITARLLIEIPKQFRDSVCWRNNTGAGVGWSIVKQAVRLLRKGNIEAAIRLLLRPMSWGLIGSSDIIMVAGPNGRFVGIEVKDPETGDKQSPEQQAFEIRIIALGGVYLVAEDVQATLAELGIRLSAGE